MRLNLLVTLFILGLTIPAGVNAADDDNPKWSLSVLGGQTEMQTANWNAVYTSKYIGSGGFALGWKYSRKLGINLGISYSSSKGKARTASGRVSSDDIKTQLIPIEISGIYRLELTKEQIVVPYAAAGFTHTLYQTELNGEERTGGLSGYHARGGVQLLLDLLEPQAAYAMKERWHIENSYLFVEYYFSEVDDFGSETNDLGSQGFIGGVTFEF